MAKRKLTTSTRHQQPTPKKVRIDRAIYYVPHRYPIKTTFESRQQQLQQLQKSQKTQKTQKHKKSKSKRRRNTNNNNNDDSDDETYRLGPRQELIQRSNRRIKFTLDIDPNFDASAVDMRPYIFLRNVMNGVVLYQHLFNMQKLAKNGEEEDDNNDDDKKQQNKDGSDEDDDDDDDEVEIMIPNRKKYTVKQLVADLGNRIARATGGTIPLSFFEKLVKKTGSHTAAAAATSGSGSGSGRTATRGRAIRGGRGGGRTAVRGGTARKSIVTMVKKSENDDDDDDDGGGYGGDIFISKSNSSSVSTAAGTVAIGSEVLSEGDMEMISNSLDSCFFVYLFNSEHSIEEEYANVVEMIHGWYRDNDPIPTLIAFVCRNTFRIVIWKAMYSVMDQTVSLYELVDDEELNFGKATRGKSDDDSEDSDDDKNKKIRTKMEDEDDEEDENEAEKYIEEGFEDDIPPKESSDDESDSDSDDSDDDDEDEGILPLFQSRKMWKRIVTTDSGYDYEMDDESNEQSVVYYDWNMERVYCYPVNPITSTVAASSSSSSSSVGESTVGGSLSPLLTQSAPVTQVDRPEEDEDEEQHNSNEGQQQQGNASSSSAAVGAHHHHHHQQQQQHDNNGDNDDCDHRTLGDSKAQPVHAFLADEHSYSKDTLVSTVIEELFSEQDAEAALGALPSEIRTLGDWSSLSIESKNNLEEFQSFPLAVRRKLDMACIRLTQIL